jgi:hypothetical protein
MKGYERGRALRSAGGGAVGRLVSERVRPVKENYGGVIVLIEDVRYSSSSDGHG